jgi:choline dehydrogenase
MHANYLTADLDCRTVVAGLKLMNRLAQTPALRPIVAETMEPPGGLSSDKDLLDYARQVGHTSFHPTSTCRMGSDAGAVVDPSLKVNGVAGLYVADASIMPVIVSGNTNVPSVMIGERGAELLMRNERSGQLA